MPLDCTILILTYKGIHHLEFLLPTVKTLIENSPEYKIDVLIVDNGDDIKTREFVEKEYGEYKIVSALANDYLFSLNDFVADLKAPYVYILNDDMKLDADALNVSLPILKKDPNLFSVGSNILDWEGNHETIGVRIMEYSRGWMRHFFIKIPDKKVRYTLYGGGGAAVFCTEKYNALKGFSTLYRPAYGEDCDLGHRAWKKGWPSVLQPASIMYHREGGTINEQFASDELTQKVYKNNYLWMIRNVDVPGFLMYFFLLLPLRELKWKRNNENLYLAMKMARPQIKDALRLRKADGVSKMKDKEIIKLLNQPYEFKR